MSVRVIPPRPGVVLALLLVSYGVWNAPAGAAPATKAEELIRQGNQLRRDGRELKALPLFQSAYEIDHSPRSAASLGLCEAALGRLVDSERHLKEGLAARGHPWIEKYRDELEDALARVRSRVGEVLIEGAPVGAEVLLGDRPVGTLPMPAPIRVGEGEAALVIRSEGYQPETRTLTIVGGKQQRLSIKLKIANAGVAGALTTRGAVSPQGNETTSPPALSAPPSAIASAGASPPSPSSTTHPTITTTATQTESGDRSAGTWQRPVAWAAAGGAALGVAGGIVALVIRNQKADEARSVGCVIMNGTVSPPNPESGERCLDLAETSGQAGVGAVVSFSIAGVLAAGSAILFATAPAKAQLASALTCAPSPTLTGATCQLRF